MQSTVHVCSFCTTAWPFTNLVVVVVSVCLIVRSFVRSINRSFVCSCVCPEVLLYITVFREKITSASRPTYMKY